jgi:hypothetical protein
MINRRRFGLFSCLGSNALGDNSKQYFSKNKYSVKTGPKNFLVGKRRKRYFS